MPSERVREFLKNLERSNLVEPAALREAKEEFSSWPESASDAERAAMRLVEKKLITRFQAEQLLAGKYKFFVGKYKVMGLIGTGGMGRVYLAQHAVMRRLVALKVLPKAKAADSAALARFQREARAVAALNHPNIVQAYDIDQDGDLHYLVMEYVVGMSAQEYVRRFGPLPPAAAADVIAQAADGLAHAHRAGIIHRDIKPGNLLIDAGGRVRILDMGLAVFFEEREHDPLTLANEENVLGTADYLSPEQALDSHNVDIRSDIYGLGATLYYLLSGRPPFASGSIAQKLLHHQTKEPPPIRQLVPQTPEGLAAVLKRMIAKKPNDRFSTPEELREALLPFARPLSEPFPSDVLAELQAEATSPISRTSRPPTSDAGGDKTRRPAGKTDPMLEPLPEGPRSAPSARPSAAGQAAGKPESAAGPARSRLSSAKPAATTEADEDFLRALADSATGGSTARLPKAKPAAAPAWLRSLAADRRAWIAGAAGAALVILLAVTGAWWTMGTKPKPATPAPAGTTVSGPAPAQAEPPSRLVVSKDPDARFIFIEEALSEARTGQTVVLAPRSSGAWETPTLRIGVDPLHVAAGVTLAGEKPSVVLALGPTFEPPLLSVEKSDRWTVRDLILDGGGKPGPVLLVRGDGAKGLAIENVTVRNFSGVGIRFENAQGTPDRPLILRNVTISPGKGGAKGAVVDDGRRIVFDQCRFLGPMDAALVASGKDSEVRIASSMIENARTAVLLESPRPAADAVVLENCILQGVKSRVASADDNASADSQSRKDDRPATKK